MKKFASLLLSLFLMSGTAFADSPKDSPKPTDAPPAKTTQPAKPATAEKSSAEIAAEVEELRQVLQTQQEELQLLKEELAKRDKQIEDARETAAAANSRATEATAKASEAVATSAEAKTTTSALNTAVTSLAAGNAAVVSGTTRGSSGSGQGTGSADDEKGPTTIRYKGVSITPGGFLAAETAYRSLATGGDIATPFSSEPYNAADISHSSENVFTGRQSRLSLLVQSKVGTTDLGGYYEADFLGVGTTSNNRQTNSYVFRQRQLYAAASFASGWTVSGGQMWSMATENKKGIMNRDEDLPMMIDPNYVVGLTWARQYGFRVVKTFDNKFSLGVSVEGPQATIGGRGFSSVTTINSAAAPAVIVTSGTTTAVTGNFFINAPGAAGGLYNAFDATGYTVNKAPDFIFKAAADPGFGHYEVFGILSLFRDRIYPCGVVGTNANDTAPPAVPTSYTANCLSPTPTVVSSFGAFDSSATGGGGGISALWPLFSKRLDLGAKAVAGDGIGRYGSAQLADATARPSGSLALIRTAHGLVRAEFHATPKLDLYAYWGLEYAWRAGYSGYETVTVTKTAAIPGIPATLTSPALPAYPATTTTKLATGIGGYGNVAANNTGCATEGVTLNDFNPSNGSNCAGDTRLIKETTVGFWYKFYQGPKGRMQMGLQYSYLSRFGWSGNGGLTAGETPISPNSGDNMVFTSFRFYLP